MTAVLLEDALRQLGCETFKRAINITTAIVAASATPPDLIVTSRFIKGGTGADAVLAICSERAIPVIFVTSSGPKVRAILPDAVIVDKPFALADLAAAVAEAVKRRFL